MMKKKNLKSLKLNKKSISNLEQEKTYGGYISEAEGCVPPKLPPASVTLCGGTYCIGPAGPN